MEKILFSTDNLYHLIFRNNQINWFNKHKFVSKTETKCLHCHETIYISFKQVSVQNVFCKNCKNRADKTNIIQQKYVSLIKNKQRDLMEKFS